MVTEASFPSALAAYREGRHADAVRMAQDIWRAASDARAAGLIARIETEARNFDAALAWSDRARSADPRDVRYAVQGARAAALKGDHTDAYERFEALLTEAPRTDDAWSEFADAARACGREAEARAFCIHAFDAHPTAVLTLLALLSLTPDTPAQSPAATDPGFPRFPLSVITCSNDDTQFASMAESYGRALAGWPHEIVRIADATSLAEGYTRGAARAKGEVLMFTHDDVEILAPDFGNRLARRLSDCDVLGIAGATRASGPGWPFAGWPYLHGSVIYPAENGQGYHVTVYSRTAPLARGIRVMDGVFLAMRREVAVSIGWDAETCDGFHGYDVDFTLRAAQAGLRLAVASDLGVVHRSYGDFDERWAATARKLQAKHAELNGVRGYEVGYVARSEPDAAHAMALTDNWARMGS